MPCLTFSEIPLNPNQKRQPKSVSTLPLLQEAGMKSITRRGMTRAFLLLLVVSTVAVVPQRASAADQLLMHVPGIPGSSQTRAGWIDVTSFSGDAVAPSTSNGNGRSLQSSTLPCEVTVMKPLDIAGPRLWAATVTGQTFSTVELQVVQATGVVTPYVFYDILLKNAQITSVSDSGTNEFPTETISFKSAEVTLAFTPQNDDGSPGTPVTSTFSCN
jgi:type VI protein secretion system component Hcp